MYKRQVELTPTYNVDPSLAFGLMAGGKEAMYRAIEGAEDSKELAIHDLKDVNLSEKDIVIGIAASGRTPVSYTHLDVYKRQSLQVVELLWNTWKVKNYLVSQ